MNATQLPRLVPITALTQRTTPRNYLSACLLSAAAACMLLQSPEVLAQPADAAAPSSSAGTNTAADCASVTVQNVRPSQGRVMLAVFDSAETFQRKPAAAMMLAANGEESVRFTLCGLMGKQLAFTVFQDINANGKFDMNLMGIPAEPWGASGQVSAFSAPSWASSQVTLQAGGLNIALSQ